jgi:GTP-binding protein
MVKLEDHESFVLADIPGLIQGAHQGKGLGTEFLKHIQRTRLLLYLLDVTSEDVKGDYQALIKEIRMFDPLLYQRPKMLALNKIDLLPRFKKTKIGNGKIPICYISALTGRGLEDLLKTIKTKLKEIRKEEEVSGI